MEVRCVLASCPRSFYLASVEGLENFIGLLQPVSSIPEMTGHPYKQIAQRERTLFALLGVFSTMSCRHSQFASLHHVATVMAEPRASVSCL